ncbi:MAG: hypothetical protein JWL68_1180 [Actinomycetia bacterium]|nr:hypothetical protein [Actinomycetes bacterium]
MDDVTLEVSAANRGLRDRPDTEMIAFNKAATGYTDGALLCITARGTDGELRGGQYGWTWAAAATSIGSGSGNTSAGLAWAASSWPPPSKRSGIAVPRRFAKVSGLAAVRRPLGREHRPELRNGVGPSSD